MHKYNENQVVNSNFGINKNLIAMKIEKMLHDIFETIGLSNHESARTKIEKSGIEIMPPELQEIDLLNEKAIKFLAKVLAPHLETSTAELLFDEISQIKRGKKLYPYKSDK
jgi:hypothetical protein